MLAPELAPATPTEGPEENLPGVKFFGPRDGDGPTLVNHRRWRYVIKVGGVQQFLQAHVVPMKRKPLLAVGEDDKETLRLLRDNSLCSIWRNSVVRIQPSRTIELGAIEVKSPFPRAGGTAAQ